MNAGSVLSKLLHTYLLIWFRLSMLRYRSSSKDPRAEATWHRTIGKHASKRHGENREHNARRQGRQDPREHTGFARPSDMVQTREALSELLPSRQNHLLFHPGHQACLARDQHPDACSQSCDDPCA